MKKLVSYLTIIIGGCMTAAAFGLFVLKQDFVAGGVTGLSVILQNFIPLKLSLIILAVNILLFGLGWVFAGKEFILKTMIMTLLFPVALDVFSKITIFDVMKEDPLLSSLLAGCLLGIGSGLILRANGSSGGFDILGVVLNKKFRLNISAVMYVCDCTVILCQAINKPIMKTVYGILVIFITSMMINKVLTFGKSEIQLFVFSQKNEEIRKELLETFDTGMTFLDAESGYTRNAAKVILAIVPYKKVNDIKKSVYAIDETAFVVMNDVHSVSGKGFTLNR